MTRARSPSCRVDVPPGMHLSFFEHDPEIGRTVWLIFDDQGVPRGAHVEQEADAIFEANAQAMRASEGAGRFGDYNRIASIPLTLYEKTGIGDAVAAKDRKYISKVLNDSDLSKIRTSRGRV